MLIYQQIDFSTFHWETGKHVSVLHQCCGEYFWRRYMSVSAILSQSVISLLQDVFCHSS